MPIMSVRLYLFAYSCREQPIHRTDTFFRRRLCLNKGSGCSERRWPVSNAGNGVRTGFTDTFRLITL